MAELKEVVPFVAAEVQTTRPWETLLEYVSPARFATLSAKSEAYKQCIRNVMAIGATDEGKALARILIVADIFEHDGAIQLDEPFLKYYLTQHLVRENQFVRDEIQALTQDAVQTYCDMLEAEGMLDATRAYTLIAKDSSGEGQLPLLRVERVGYLDDSVQVPNRESRTLIYRYRFGGDSVAMESVKHGGYGNHWERGHRELKDQMYSYRHVAYLAKHYDWLLTFMEHLADFTVEVFDTIDRDIDDRRIQDKAAFEEGIKQKLLNLVAKDVLGETD